MRKYKIILEKEDYDFLNLIYDKYKIPEGKGIRNFIEIAINEYKIKAENKTQGDSE